ncbi:uncharacterized protein BXZ73DRAFT_47994 [Epithele typhae]|uniref:uncharacterized protein n=1 Tax=Epithele typhae TaxID=378194 RepID=UPI002007AAA9|nr:uncharacterized protein BXZ73DRAFT_47994 [Epithele typhae]KAH9929533.1 hypothetical protein BXZ73DRAFT_47994 [Epithele typhae]
MLLNVGLLVVCVVLVIFLVLYLFYWNRFFAFIFSLILRLALWNQEESSIWLEFGSFHFSTLAGRILIKDLRYHSSNQTFRIVKVQASWRYWLRRPAEEEDLSHARVIGEEKQGMDSSPLGCRIHITLQGLEWFMYNRTSSFDNILSQLNVDIPTIPGHTPLQTDGTPSVRKIFSRTTAPASILGSPLSLVSSIYKQTPRFFKTGADWLRSQMPKLDPKDLLPISIGVLKGAITIGNSSTPNLLIAEFQRADGTYGIVEARSKHDEHKQVMNFRLHNPSVSYVENDQYLSPMTEVGRRAHELVNRADGAPLRHSSYLSFSSFRRIWSQLKLWTLLVPLDQTLKSTHYSMPVSHPQSWGRRKQQKNEDDETRPGGDAATREYAIERKILEANVVELLYYVDVVGLVPALEPGHQAQIESLDPFEIGNGDLPPEWGIDLVIRGGFIRYGPWADRQRALLQQAFFPPAFATASLTERLKPGDMRMWTGMKVFIELRDGVTLQLPFREASKNWQWDGKVDYSDRPKKREAASIHVRAGDSSTISYVVPMIASTNGYLSMLEVHLDTVTMTSSLNDIRLLSAETCRIRSHLPAPLKWNGSRQWTFAISLRQPCFYLLRDHINMFADLGKDWVSGPPGDLNTFIPMIYVIDLDMHNYSINLYVNDHNIIDKPLIKEENALLTLHGTHFTLGAQMPFTKYRPDVTTVSFWLEVPDVYVDLSLPRWNIFSMFATPDRSQVGRIGMLNMNGSYRYFAETKPDNVDQLTLNFTGRDLIYKAFGWTIRYFMIMRDNYFGSFTHFSTLTEYLRGRKRGQPLGDPIQLQYREGSSNAMQVTMGLEVQTGLIVVPAGFYGYERYIAEHAHSSPEDLGPCLLLSLPSSQLHLRSNDYYMEMSLNIDTITGRFSEHCYNSSVFTTTDHFGSKRQKIVIDGLDVVANRLFGHRPATSTYVCIWEIHVGDLKAALNAYDCKLLSAVGSSFGLNFSDPLNSPAKEFAVTTDPDVTFLKVKIDSVNAIWSVGTAAAEFSLPSGLRIDMNDLAGKTFRKVTGIRLLSGIVRLFLASKQDHARWLETGDVKFDVDVDIYSAPLGWRESAMRQIEFIVEQDAATGRAKILYSPEDLATPSHRLRPGRGMLDNDFYLPQIRIPRLYPVDGSHDRLAVPMAYLREELSESDLDPVPEAERDARLADLRPASFATEVPSDYETGFSSGDESDEHDTDWSTDYADTIDDASLESSWPSVNQYSALCRHYEGRSVARPLLWDRSPFSITKDVSRNTKSSVHSLDADVLPMAALPTVWTDADRDDPEDGNKSVFRVHSKDGVIVWITPLVLPVISYLLADLVSSQLSPELRFDALAARYIRSFGVDHVDSVNLFDLHIPSVEVRSVQLVHALSSRTAVKTNNQALSGELCITVAEFLSTHIRLRGRLAPGQTQPSARDITFAFSSMSVALLSKFPVSRAYKHDHMKICHLALGPSLASIICNDATLSLGVISSDISHTGPNYILGTLVVLARYIGGIFHAHKASKLTAPPTNLETIHGTLIQSRDTSIVDPLSTIQPSYLVQQGLPDKLRKDATLKFLVYLRGCLRLLSEHQRAQLHLPQADISITEILDNVQSQLLGTGDDTSSNPSQQTLLQELLRGPRKKDSTTPKEDSFLKLPFDTFTFTLAGLRLHLRHPAEPTESDFTSGPSTIHFVHQHADLVSSTVWSPGKSYPNVTTRDKERHDLHRLALTITLDHISSTVHPEVVEFVQVVLKDYKRHGVHMRSAWRHTRPQDTDKASIHSLAPRPALSVHQPMPTLSVDVTLAMRSFTFTAATEQLLLRFKNAEVTYASSSVATLPRTENPTPDISTNQSLSVECAVLEASSPASASVPKERTLASLTLGDAKLNMLLQQDAHKNVTCRALAGLGKLHLDVPRSALRLYRFAEGWRADYLPPLDATVRALLSEMRSSTSPRPPSVTQPQVSPSPKLLNFQVQVSVTSMKATLQVMHGTWVSWEVRDTIGFVLDEHRRKSAHLFGLQMGPHIFDISRSRAGSHHHSRHIGLRLELPTVTLRGRHDVHGLQGMALVEFVEVSVRPSDWDTLLSVQQKSGQDFNDLIRIIEQSRQKRPLAAPLQTPSSPTREKKSPFKFNGHLKMKGFRIGLQGLASTLFLECDDISGGFGSHGRSMWHVKLSDLALSLASQASIGTPSHRDRRSAFVRVDAEASMGKKTHSALPHLDVKINKIHAVMQPSSIGQLGDFFDHLQAEVLIQKEQRANDLEEFKEKTKSLMKSLDVKLGETSTSERSLLELYTASIIIQNIGVAFPLTLARDLQMSRSGSHDDNAVRAFLFSIKSLKFGTQSGENGQASMSNFSFQFVSRFRQNNPADFSGESHKTRNRLVYPEMTANIRSEHAGDARRVCVFAEVDGFVLDVDSTIPDFISSLLDVYRQGKDRVERLAGAVPRPSPSIETPPPTDTTQTEQRYSALPTSNILASLTFSSGKVRMHSRDSSSQPPRSRPLSTLLYGRSDDSNGAEEFNLPEVSVWGEFRATPAVHKLSSTGQAAEPSTLMFKSTIHSSQNTLRPTLLPFLSELMNKIEDHMRTANAPGPPASPGPKSGLLPPIATTPITPIPTPEELSTRPSDPVSSMKISFSLRIDQSKLLLTCRPDANVIGGLHWDSGGFVVNIAPGARRISFTGTVGGLTVSLKHGFLSEDCVKLDARNLNFSVAFAKLQQKNRTLSSISVVLDTEFSGGLRFSRFQDVLCFKAVWLDRIPAIGGAALSTPVDRLPPPTSALPIPVASHGSVTGLAEKQELTTAVLVRLRQVELDVDLGQSISNVKLTLDDTTVRTKITEVLSELSLAIGKFSIVASGNLSGHADMPDFHFQTVRRQDLQYAKRAGGRMLDLSMTSGVFTVKLDSEYHELIRYRAEPISIYIFDDWSDISSDIAPKDRRVNLDFVVTGSDILAIMTVGTIPKLVSYANKFRSNLETQKEGARRESKAFRIANTPKPDNPLSAVANAMIKSARSRLKEHETGLCYAIGQRMSLKLQRLRLVVFPRSMRDPELAQFVGEDVHARLQRLIWTDNEPAQRTLQLYFSGMTVSRYNQLHHSIALKDTNGYVDSREWLSAVMAHSSEAIIFGLPSMDMRMYSEEPQESQDDGVRRKLEYDFGSSFSKASARDAEDIYISLNMSLYSWLTVLRKTFAREMEAAQLSSGGVGTSVAAVPLASRKKHESISSPLATDKDRPSGTERSRAKKRGSISSRPIPLTLHSADDASQLVPLRPPQPSASVSPSATLSLASCSSPPSSDISPPSAPATLKSVTTGLLYVPKSRKIERLTMRQLGEATPDVMHPFFMKKAGFNLEDSLPQYVHEYATLPTEEIMKMLLKLYTRQLTRTSTDSPTSSIL